MEWDKASLERFRKLLKELERYRPLPDNVFDETVTPCYVYTRLKDIIAVAIANQYKIPLHIAHNIIDILGDLESVRILAKLIKMKADLDTVKFYYNYKWSLTKADVFNTIMDITEELEHDKREN